MLPIYGEREGLNSEQLALPTVMLATFQNISYDLLVSRTAARVPIPAPTRPGAALAAATNLLVGATPGGTAVTITRFL